MGIKALAAAGAAGAVVTVAIDATLPRHGLGLPLLAWTVGMSLVLILGLRRNRPSHPLPWQLIAVTQVVAAFAFTIQDVLGRPALNMPGVSHALIIVGELCSIVAFGLFVRYRSRALDRYLLLDMAIFLVSASVALKELVLNPSMDAHPPIGISRNLSATYIILGLVLFVLIAQLMTLPGRRTPSMWLLLTTALANLAGSVFVNTLTNDSGRGISAGTPLIICVVITALAAWHPSMVTLTEPAVGDSPVFGSLRLMGLGTSIFLAPLTMVLVYQRTDRLNPVLILGVAVVLTVLVMVRLRLLFAREQAAREEVAASREAFSALVHGISDVILVVDAGGSIAYATASAGRTLGIPAGDLSGQCLPAIVHEEDTDELHELFADIVGSGATAYRTVRVMVEGQERVFELEASDRVDTPSLMGLIVVLHDVTDRHQLEDELRHQAYHDSLTGLPNRELLVERLGDILRGDGPVSVLFVDLDDFKDVNDGLGHQAGDELLRAVAERLRGAVRDRDIVARLGGDEFAILVTGGERGEAQHVARRIIESLATPFDLSGTMVNMGASVGIATGAAHSVNDLLRNADVAMYRAKAAGKGTLALFEPGMHDAAAERLSLHADLTGAIDDGQFRLLYQPVFELETGLLRGGEALVRWQHPTLGLLLPDRFIGLAEDTGLIVPLGRWVLEAACTEALGWPEVVGIAVNLSPRQLERDGFVDEVRAILRKTGIRPARLVLEITESVIAQDVESIVARLSAIRGEGVRIAIDDFGTGYSSLGSLMQLPVDVLKIDRSFVATMLERPAGTAIVKVLIDMGRTLGLEVVAEGIEQEEQASTLLSQQCHQGQGTLYSPPVEPAEFATFVGQRAPMARL